MENLYIATGFMGALTLVWLVRFVLKAIITPPGVAIHFTEACRDAVLPELAAARREIILVARTLACRPIAQALIDARLRSVRVEVFLPAGGEKNAASDHAFLVEQGLPPRDLDHQPGCDYLLIDDRTIVFLNADLSATPVTGHVLVVRGHSDLVAALRAPGQVAEAAPDPLDAAARAMLQTAPAGEDDEEEEKEVKAEQPKAPAPAPEPTPLPRKDTGPAKKDDRKGSPGRAA
jgi:hypothetical protein